MSNFNRNIVESGVKHHKPYQQNKIVTPMQIIPTLQN
jgi:hypothetical protein